MTEIVRHLRTRQRLYQLPLWTCAYLLGLLFRAMRL